MTHKPKTLALLISLIGAGVAPVAYARADLRFASPPLPEFGTTIEVPPPTALDLTRWAPGLVWRQEEGSVDFDVPHAAVRAALRRHEEVPVDPDLPLAAESAAVLTATDWTVTELPAAELLPSRSSGEIVADGLSKDSPAAQAEIGALSSAAPLHATSEEVAPQGEAESLARLPVAAPDPQPRVPGWSRHLRTLIQTLVPKPASSPDTIVEPPAPAAATAWFVAFPGVPPQAKPASTHADQLMESLSTILLKDAMNLSRDRVLARLAERFPAAVARPRASMPAALATPDLRRIERRVEQPEIVVLSQSGAVLRNLEAILSNERHEAGADRAASGETIVHTHSEQVLETLHWLSSGGNAREDGATRRLRKLEAARLRAAAAAMAAVSPNGAVIGAVAPGSTSVDIDLSLPLDTEPVMAVASSGRFDDAKLSVQPAPAPNASTSAAALLDTSAAATSEVDFDLSVPAVAVPAQALAATGIDADGRPTAYPVPEPTASTPEIAPIAATERATVEVDIDPSKPLVGQPGAVVAAADGGFYAALEAEPAPEPTATETESEPRFSPFGTRAVAMSSTALDRMRGGFVANGLNISFGIERATYINGALVTSTSLNMTNLGQMTAGRGSTVLDSGTLALVQSGAGNIVTNGSVLPAAVGTVIQNTLDGQKIQNVTVINATVNSMAVMRSLNLQSSLRGAVIASLVR
jgi:hypothetical protein